MFNGCSRTLELSCGGGSFSYESGMYQCVPTTYKSYGAVELGFTAQAFAFDLLCTDDEWSELLDVFEAYQSEYQVAPIEKTDASGNTINIESAMTGGYGVSVSWPGGSGDYLFAEPPSGTPFGNYIQATFTVVNADDYYTCKKRSEYLKEQQSKKYVGTYSLWGVNLRLLEIKESYDNLPTLSMTATGVNYVEGPLKMQTVYNIVGDTDKDGWSTIYDKTKDIAEATPGAEPYPISVPSVKVTEGIAEPTPDAPEGRDEGEPGPSTEFPDIYTVTISVAIPLEA